MLTSVLRSGCLSAASVAAATQSRSPGVSSAAIRATSPNLRFAPLMDMDFAVSSPLVRHWRLISGFCPSTRTFAPRFLETPPRGDSPCVSLALHLHQVGRRTFTSKLLSMPSTQLSRCAAAMGSSAQYADWVIVTVRVSALRESPLVINNRSGDGSTYPENGPPQLF